MQRLKQIPIFCFGLLITLASCNRYQMMMVEPISQSATLTKQGYTQQLDTLSIDYQFLGSKNLMSVRLTNLTGQPLFVDTKQMALIVNGSALPMVSQQSSLQMQQSGNVLRWTEDWQSTNGRIQGVLTTTAQLSVVPPKSYVEWTTGLPGVPFLHQLPDSASTSFTKEEKIENADQFRVKSYRFTGAASPYKIGIYLPVSWRPDFSNPIIIREDFAVTRIHESMGKPVDIFPITSQYPGYIVGTKATAAGVAGGLLTIGAVTTAAVVNESTGNK